MPGQDPESERATIVCKDIPPGMQSSGFLRKLVKQKARGAEPEARIDLSASGLLKIVADADRCEELTAEVTMLTELWEAVRALRDVQTGRITLHGRTEDHFYKEVDRILEALDSGD